MCFFFRAKGANKLGRPLGSKNKSTLENIAKKKADEAKQKPQYTMKGKNKINNLNSLELDCTYIHTHTLLQSKKSRVEIFLKFNIIIYLYIFRVRNPGLGEPKTKM